MRKIKFAAIFLTVFFVLNSLYAAEKNNYQNFELDTLLHNIDKPGAPLITDDYIIFTADIYNRFVGIAFDFENYQIIHPFQVLTKTDDDGNVTRKHMFYCYKRQHKFSTIKYRMVIDGLWTVDPLNPDKEYDDNVNLYFSKVEDPDSVRIYTEETESDTVRFIYKGDTGLKLHLAGTFTNWDPWIYELKETKPGLYELELPLTTGTYYYNYYVGLTPILDNTNPNKAYAPDGRSASVITVN
ncbi:MAG: isoamylase [Treponema sp.]|nr:isoamylase [Treponema sp.]MDY5122798.1 isoamylase [Treponema sp.]